MAEQERGYFKRQGFEAFETFEAEKENEDIDPLNKILMT